MLSIIRAGIVTGLIWGIAMWVLGRFMKSAAPMLDRFWIFLGGTVKNPRNLLAFKR